jgi:predicted GNAT superfamily acetyltransferase
MTTWSAQDAREAAERRADVRVVALSDLSELDEARRVFDAVWPSRQGATQIQSNLLRALVHAGGCASAAYRGDVLVGAALAFVGRHRERVTGAWHPHLHSHMAAVLEPYRNQHVGSALKMHQRFWALEQDIDTIVWTFDPLVRRNAVLNLVKLGVDVEGFEIDFYGSMDDEINAGDPTDRLFAWWRLDSQRAAAAAAGRLGRLDPVALARSGRDVREVVLPDDIVALRAADPEAALRWRLAVRDALVDGFAQGYAIVGVSDDGYVMERQT